MALSFANGINSSRPIQKFPIGLNLFQTCPIDVTFDSAYVSGGYALTAGNFGLNEILEVRHIGWKSAPASGVGRVEYDATNTKLIVTPDGSESFLRTETVAVASHAGRLSRPPGYIIAARASAGGTTGALRIIPVGETPATGQVAVNLVTGACTFATADAVTAAIFTYIPLGVGAFIEANRVVDESNTGANDTTRQTALRAGLVQYFWNDTAGSLPTMVPVGEAPGSGEVACDINNSGDTIFTVNAGQDDATYKITYWKHSALAQAFGWTDQADITITSTTLFSFADDLAVPPNGVWVPGFGNVIVGEATATNKQAILVDAAGTAGANVGVYDPVLGKIVLDNGDGYTTIEVPYVFVNAFNCSALGSALPAGFNLSSLVARVEVIGR